MRLMFERDLTPHPQYCAFYEWLWQQQGQQGQQGQGQPAKRDAQLFALAAALAEYRKQHGVEQGVEQPSADDEMPQAAG